MNEIYQCDEFEAVSRCNFRDIKNGSYCYIYLDRVLKRTKELCDELNLKYEIQKIDDFYKIISYEKKGAKRY